MPIFMIMLEKFLKLIKMFLMKSRYDYQAIIFYNITG